MTKKNREASAILAKFDAYMKAREGYFVAVAHAVIDKLPKALKNGDSAERVTNARFELVETTIPDYFEILDDHVGEDDESRPELMAALIHDYVVDAKALGAEIVHRGQEWIEGLKPSTKADEIIADWEGPEEEDAPKVA